MTHTQPDESTEPADEIPARFRIDFTGLELLGVYNVGRKIAEGGMGSVYLAEDTTLGRPVVVKVPHPRFLTVPALRARLTREVGELVRLEHPGIVRILARGDHEDVPFFVLQYLAGGSLEDRLETGGTQAPEQVLPWLAATAGTLDYIHGRGIVHRDVKPGNILFDEDDHVFLSDFGLAKVLDPQATGVTSTGVGIGSPLYMAPEQAIGAEVGPAADQYGLAATVYEALAGRSPFGSGTPVAIIVRKAHEDPRPLSAARPDLPWACTSAVMRALSRDPDERYAMCTELAKAYRAGLDPERAAAVSTATDLPTVRRARSPAVEGRVAPGQRIAALLMAGAAVIIGVSLFVGGRDLHDGGPLAVDVPSRMASTDAPVLPVELKVLDVGRPPLRQLEYLVAEGAQEHLTMTVRTRREVKSAGPEPAPPDVLDWTLDADTLVDRIEDDGTIHFQWISADWEVGPVGGDEAVGDQLEAKLDALPGFTVDGIADGSGLLREAVLAEAGALHERVQPMLDDLRRGVLEFLAPLPREPIGVGAKWQVARWADRLGVRFMQDVTYELVSVEGYRLDLKMTTALIVPSESGVRFPGQGRGRLRVDLTQIVPTEFDSNVQGTFEEVTGQGGEARHERGTFSIHVEMHRRR